MSEDVVVAPVQAKAVPPFSVRSLDPYKDELADFDLDEAQKEELLLTLWRIMSSFVDLGFRVDICEQLFANFNEAAEASPAEVELGHPHRPEKRTQESEEP